MTQLDKIAALVAAGRATEQDMDSLGAEAVHQIKSCPDVLQVRLRGAGELSQNADKRTISYLVSDETPDRMGDIIQVKGWDLSQYKSNPVVLWAHDGHNTPPIGKANNVRRRHGPKRLTADIEFADAETHEFADTIYRLASKGFIRATSVGFLPRETAELDEKQRDKMGLGKYGSLYTASVLMEISIVAVPANPSALEDGVKSLIEGGHLDKSMGARFLEIYPKDETTSLERFRASCRSFGDFGATAIEDKAHEAEPEAAPEEKSPACRMEDESTEECVSRKIPELVEEGMEPDQAAAVAASVCETSCSDKAHPGDAYDCDDDDELSARALFLNGMAWLIEQQAEQTKATRQLVDALSDLTQRLHAPDSGGEHGGEQPDAVPSDAGEKDGEDLTEILDSRIRGFADDMRRDILTNTPRNQNGNQSNV